MKVLLSLILVSLTTRTAGLPCTGLDVVSNISTSLDMKIIDDPKNGVCFETFSNSPNVIDETSALCMEYGSFGRSDVYRAYESNYVHVLHGSSIHIGANAYVLFRQTLDLTASQLSIGVDSNMSTESQYPPITLELTASELVTERATLVQDIHGTLDNSKVSIGEFTYLHRTFFALQKGRFRTGRYTTVAGSQKDDCKFTLQNANVSIGDFSTIKSNRFRMYNSQLVTKANSSILNSYRGTMITYSISLFPESSLVLNENAMLNIRDGEGYGYGDLEVRGPNTLTIGSGASLTILTTSCKVTTNVTIPDGAVVEWNPGSAPDRVLCEGR